MAKKFTYRLEPILSIRSHLAQKAKEELIYIVSLRNQKEFEIENKKEYLHKLNKIKFISSKAKNLQTMVFHKLSVSDEIKILDKEKQQLLEIEAVKLTKYYEAKKEEKILEKLKEKQFSNYFLESRKEEVKILDELSITRYRVSK